MIYPAPIYHRVFCFKDPNELDNKNLDFYYCHKKKYINKPHTIQFSDLLHGYAGQFVYQKENIRLADAGQLITTSLYNKPYFKDLYANTHGIVVWCTINDLKYISFTMVSKRLDDPITDIFHQYNKVDCRQNLVFFDIYFPFYSFPKKTVEKEIWKELKKNPVSEESWSALKDICIDKDNIHVQEIAEKYLNLIQESKNVPKTS